MASYVQRHTDTHAQSLQFTRREATERKCGFIKVGTGFLTTYIHIQSHIHDHCSSPIEKPVNGSVVGDGFLHIEIHK